MLKHLIPSHTLSRVGMPRAPANEGKGDARAYSSTQPVTSTTRGGDDTIEVASRSMNRSLGL